MAQRLLECCDCTAIVGLVSQKDGFAIVALLWHYWSNYPIYPIGFWVIEIVNYLEDMLVCKEGILKLAGLEAIQLDISAGYPTRVPSATGASRDRSTTSPSSGSPPRTNTCDENPAIRRGGMFTTATTCLPTRISGL